MDAPKDEKHSHRKWSNLLDELLHKIWQQHVDPQLQTDVRRRLRAVCTSWRASVPLTIAIPNQRVNVPNSFDASLSETAFYLVENTFYLITPLENPKTAWLVRAEERGHNLYRMRNPFCGSYCLFYMYHPFCITSKIDNLLNYQIREVYRSYTVKRSYRSLPHSLFQLEPSLQKPLRKIITSNLNGFTPFTALGLTCTGFLVFWRQGDTKWTKLVKFRDETHKDRLVETVSDDEIGDDDKFALFVDIAVHKGKFYAIEMETGDVYVIDLVSIAANDIRPFTVEVRMCFSSSQSPVTQFTIDNRGCYLSNCSFVECKGRLYYINHVRHQSNNQCDTKLLYVLKDDKNGSEWEYVEGLEAMTDQVIFLLGEASFVVPEADGLGKAGVLSTSKYVPDNLMHKYGQVHVPFEGCFQKCTFRKPEDDDDEDDEVASTSLSRDDDCNTIFFPPPPWLKSYYKTQWNNSPLKFTELFDSSF